jgi:hypothetical protein
MKLKTCKFCKGTKFKEKDNWFICSNCKGKVKEDNKYGSHLIWKKTLIFLISLTFLSFIFAFPTILETIGYPNGTVTSNSSVVFEYNISSNGEGISNITWSWDNTNYSIYDDSLVLFMNFDNRSALGENDTEVKDLSRYGNNGTVVGGENITWIPNGKYDGAFNFSGRVNYISVPTLNLSTLSKDNFTLSAWVYNNGDTTTQTIFGTNGGFILRYYTSLKKVAFYSKAGILVNWFDINMSNKWTNIFLRFDSTSNESELYINGISKGNGDVNQTDDLSGNDLLMIGKWSTQYWNGSVDDVMIWNRSLSQAEITQHYYSSLTKYNSQNWTFWTNQTLNTSSSFINSTNPTYNYNYFLCSSNSTGSENCTSQKTITQIIPTKSLVANFSNNVRVIPNDMYGATTGYVSTANGVYDFDRTKFLNSGLKVVYLPVQEGYWNNNSDGSLTLNPTYETQAEGIKSYVQWAKDNNLKVFFMGAYYGEAKIPTWLRNKTSDCSSDNSSCAPLNYTKYAQIQLTALNYYTNNGEWLDIIIGFSPYNEPHSALLKSNSLQSAKMNVYYQIYNTSRSYIKANSTFNSLPIGGPSGHFGYGTNDADYIRWDWWFANFTNQIDFVDLHIYRNDNLVSRFNFKLNSDFYGNCTLYGGNCSKIFVSEFNVYNKSALSSDYWALQIGDFYQNTLNLQNISLSFYNFNSTYWGLINSTGEITTAYNVTSSFAHLCPAGGTVYQSSSDDDTIKTVSCKDGNKYNVIVINTDTSSKNVTLSQLPSITNGRLVEYETTNYIPLSSSIDLGIMDSYEIKYLTSDVCSSGYLLESDGVTCTTTAKQSACEDSLSAFVSYVALVGLLGTIIFFGWLMAYLFGFVDKDVFNEFSIIGSLVTLILIAVLIIIAVFILSTLCDVF